MFDFNKFDKAKLLSSALALTGYQWRTKTVDQARGPCPFHGSSPRSRSLAINLRTGSWYCHKCKRRGDALDWAIEKLQYTLFQAIRVLHHHAGIPIPEKED